jgi:hypothetical protein
MTVRARLAGAAAERTTKAKSAEHRPHAPSGHEAQQVPPDLERLIHERMRLGIVSALAVNPSLTFNELKALLKTTDGNLCIHARKLEEAAYIASNRSQKTSYRLTAAGRRALERYLDHMEALIRATRER